MNLAIFRLFEHATRWNGSTLCVVPISQNRMHDVLNPNTIKYGTIFPLQKLLSPQHYISAPTPNLRNTHHSLSPTSFNYLLFKYKIYIKNITSSKLDKNFIKKVKFKFVEEIKNYIKLK